MKLEVNLKEILYPRMDILFVALNPPVISNRNEHYFSNNLSFWNLLYRSELIVRAVQNKFTGDEEIFRNQANNYKGAVFGITDLVHDKLETYSVNIKVEAGRVERISKILETHATKVLCLMHSKVALAFQQQGLIKRHKNYGMVGSCKTTLIYEVPFHNASVPDKHIYYSLLKATL
jgi:hypothetical protein